MTTCHGTRPAGRVLTTIELLDELLAPLDPSNEDMRPPNSKDKPKGTLAKENNTVKERSEPPCHEVVAADSEDNPIEVNLDSSN